MKQREEHIVLKYLKERKFTIFIFLELNFTYFIVYALYGVSKDAFNYGLELAVFFSAVYLYLDFRKFRQKHDALKNLRNSIEVSSIRNVDSVTPIEQDYQELIDHMQSCLAKVMQENDERKENQRDYLTMWTHQIKTPVAALRLILANMEYSAEKSSLEQELFRIEEYIGMVLQYQRLESISQDLLFQKYDLYQLVKQAVKKYSIVFIHKHLSLEMDEFACEVISDEKWIVFVFEQILSNALKYTNKGKIHIYREGEKTLVIEDTGIGIRAEDIGRVFERGYTGYNGRLDKKSTGIGMYLCKNIVDHLGHKIQIASEKGKGTKVSIDFMEYHLDARD